MSCMYGGNKWVLEQIAKSVLDDKSHSILDIGCATGIEACFLARNLNEGGKVVGIDISPAILSLAKERANKRCLDNIDFINVTRDKLPFSEQSFDTILYIRSLMEGDTRSYTPEDLTTFHDILSRRLIEARRILRENGRLMVVEISSKDYFFKTYKKSQIGSIIGSAGFVLEGIASQDFEAPGQGPYSFIVFKAKK